MAWLGSGKKMQRVLFVSGPRSVDASQDNQKRKRASLVEVSPSHTMDLEEQSQGLCTNLSHGIG